MLGLMSQAITQDCNSCVWPEWIVTLDSVMCWLVYERLMSLFRSAALFSSTCRKHFQQKCCNLNCTITCHQPPHIAFNMGLLARKRPTMWRSYRVAIATPYTKYQLWAACICERRRRICYSIELLLQSMNCGVNRMESTTLGREWCHKRLVDEFGWRALSCSCCCCINAICLSWLTRQTIVRHGSLSMSTVADNF